MNHTVVKVRYLGTMGAAPQKSVDGSTVYIFSGNAPVIVRNAEDITRFKVKAQKNPGVWEVVDESPVTPLKKVMAALKGEEPVPRPAGGTLSTKDIRKVG